MSVGHDREPCEQRSTDRDAAAMWTRVAPSSHVRSGGQL